MCGIVGIISEKPVADRLLSGLKRLEYRGYDSAGIVTLNHNTLEIRRAAGKLQALQDLVANSPIKGNIGIGHTRWATHGTPTKENAHPHSNNIVSVVHNGIIENYATIKDRLETAGYVFQSQTDTESIVHLMTDYLKQGKKPLQALQSTLKEIEGAFALAILITGHEDMMLVARHGSPLVIGHGDHENMVGSDALALAPWIKDVQYLEDGDYAEITKNSVKIYDCHDLQVERPIRQSELTGDTVSKGTFDHFMLKEIFEQPVAIKETLLSLINTKNQTIQSKTQIDWTTVPRLTIVACGTSFYAASVAKYWFEILAHLPVDIDIASEFRYRECPLTPKGVALFISQSGETIDTLMALNLCKAQDQHIIGLVNAPESSIARQSNHVLYTIAGPEIGVASTKAFTAQMAVLACLAIEAAHARGHLTPEQISELLNELLDLPTILYQVLQNDAKFQEIGNLLKEAQDVLYLGRGTNYPIALEGALKLKELSYIHAEGCAAGEIKHGPIALIDDTVPVIVVAPHDRWMTKTLSNMQEVVARGAKAICFTDADGRKKIEADKIDVIVVEMPSSNLLTAPIIYSLPMQLLAYYTALLRGADVDQPRNLAKSVTVE